MGEYSFYGMMNHTKSFCCEEVQDLFHYSKEVINTISSKDNSTSLLEYQYLTFAAMLTYYGSKYQDLILDVFQNTRFQETDYNVYSTDEKNSATIYSSFTYPVITSFFPFLKKYFLPSNYVTIYIDPSIMNDAYHVLINCIHEVNHAINSSLIGSKFGHYLRYGVNFYNIDTNQFSGRFLEEAFNSLQQEEIMDNILFFGSHFEIEDSLFSQLYHRIYDSYRNSDVEKKSYDLLTELLRPLYFCPDFYYVLNNGRLSGDIRSIIENFESTVGSGSWLELSQSVDNLWLGRENENRAQELIYRYTSRHER